VAKTLKQSFKDLNLGFKKHPVTDDLVVTKDEAAIKQAIVSLLLTDPGERLFQPELGSGLRSFLFEPLDSATAALINASVRDTLNRYEPRIDIIDITTTPNSDENGYEVSLSFEVVGTEIAPLAVELFLERTR
jgi:phage baseplate assembly protein W